MCPIEDHLNNHQLRSLIISGFHLKQDEIKISNNAEYLRLELAKVIQQLLNNDMEYLLRVLYRIDVDESKVKSVLATHKVENLADDLTSLVIERLQQKLYYRNKYK